MTEPTDTEEPAGGRVTAELIREAIDSNKQVAASNETLALAMVEYQERAKLAAARDEAAKQRDADARVRDKKLFRLVAVGLSVILVVVLAGLGFLAWRQSDANDAAQASRSTLLDCTVPGGDCYQRSQQQTADIVDNLIRGTIIATVCANAQAGLGTVDEQVQAAQLCLARELGH